MCSLDIGVVVSETGKAPEVTIPYSSTGLVYLYVLKPFEKMSSYPDSECPSSQRKGFLKQSSHKDTFAHAVLHSDMYFTNINLLVLKNHILHFGTFRSAYKNQSYKCLQKQFKTTCNKVQNHSMLQATPQKKIPPQKKSNEAQKSTTVIRAQKNNHSKTIQKKRF